MALSLAERGPREPIRSGSVLLAGGYAWASTVLFPAFERGSPRSARVAAVAAAVALVAGCSILRQRSGVGRLLGLHAFLGFALLTWVFALPAVSVDRLDPVRGALGALAWIIFSLSWGLPREPARVPEEDPRVLAVEPLPARQRTGFGPAVATATGIVGAALPLAAAFTVSRKEHALFAHAVAVGLAIAILSASAEIATTPWSRTRPSARPAPGRRQPVLSRLSSAAIPLALVVILVIAGLAAHLGN